MLPDEAIQQFIDLYYLNYGIRLERAVAVDKANRLFRMVKTVVAK